MPTEIGTNGNDVLHFDNTYTVIGLAGDDSLDAGIMWGGANNDYYRVDSATDQVKENISETNSNDAGGKDVVFSWIESYTLTNFVEDLMLEEGSSARKGYGNSLANKITGNDAGNLLKGNGGKDELIGGAGNDDLRGGGQGDRLIGFGGFGVSAGKNEIDILKGDAGSDTFVLWASGGNNEKFAAYNDGILIQFVNGSVVYSAGLTDYAHIKDFSKSADKIELAGSASNYSLKAAPNSLGISGTAIYLNQSTLTGGTTGELIAVLENVSLSQVNLNSSYFQYV